MLRQLPPLMVLLGLCCLSAQRAAAQRAATQRAAAQENDAAAEGVVQVLVDSANAIGRAVDQSKGVEHIEYTVEDYKRDREAIIVRSRSHGGSLLLVTEQMRKAKEHFSAIRATYLNRFRGAQASHQFEFPATRPFPLVKADIENTDAFRLLRRMPKGAQLHLHSSAAGRADWLVDHLDRFDDEDKYVCWVNWPSDEELQQGKVISGMGGVTFMKARAKVKGWRRASELKQTEGFREKFLSTLTLTKDDFNLGHSRSAWDKFNGIFSKVSGFISYQPAFRAYFEDALRSHLDDGVQHVELRTSLGAIKTPEGVELRAHRFVNEYREVLKAIQQDHPEFSMKLIITIWRGVSVEHVRQLLESLIEIEFDGDHHLVIGMDLIGREEFGKDETRKFLPVWLELRQFPPEFSNFLGMYFHDGESSWAGNSNIVDATMLGAKRIGHGFNLVNYPEIESVLKQKRIALEVCPISNQLLRYVGDLRIHPASGYIRRGIPCVIASDDPMIFGNHGLSYDFWIAWMAWGLSLDDIERLVQNSITFSGLSEQDGDHSEKAQHRVLLKKRWSQFIAHLASDDYLDWIRQ